MPKRVDPEKIRPIMKDAGVKVDDIAAKLGLSLRHTKRIVKGSQNLSDKHESTLREIFGEDADIFKDPGDEKAPSIAIVGLGFSGTATAIRLMQLASSKLKITIFEPQTMQKYGGFVYGSNSLLKEHALNIHAGRISLFRERPDDFLKWAAEDADRKGKDAASKHKDNSTDRKTWRKILNITDAEGPVWDERLKFSEYSAVPRLLYSQYLEHRFKDAEDRTKGLVEVEVLPHKVTDCDPNKRKADLTFLDSESGELDVRTFDVVVLCTGYREAIIPAGVRTISDSSVFFEHPFSVEFQGAVAECKDPNSRLLVIGSGLTAFDAAIHAAASGFPGEVALLSRNGLRHQAYPPNHSHAILPSIYGSHFEEVVTAQGMRSAVEEAIRQARRDFSRYYLDESEGVLPERVFKAIEPQVAEFVKKAEPTEVQSFISEHQSWITTNRTSVVREVWDLLKTINLCYVEGEISSSKLNESGAVIGYFPKTSVEVPEAAREPKEVSASLVVNCAGFEPCYKNASGLWGNLISNGHCVSHAKTGLGIRVGRNGKVENSNEEHSRSLYAVGPMREGDEIERRGRLGAFTFSIGTVRNQALMSALSVLKHVENREYYDLPEASRNRYRRGLIEFLENDQMAREQFHRLVTRTADIQFLPRSDGRDDALSQIIDAARKLSLNYSCAGIEEDMFSYLCWQTIRLRAGALVTEIRRLSERQSSVKAYRPGTAALCHTEKKDCKEQLKLIMGRINARSFSLSVYLPTQKYLYPFIDHLRLNRFTRTKYGCNNAGILLKGYSESIPSNELFPTGDVIPVIDGNSIKGLLIPNYNQTSEMKNLYKESPRLYPNVLVALVIGAEDVVGVVYFEAPLERKFSQSDVEMVLRSLGSIPHHLRNVSETWTPTADLDRQSTIMDFEKAKLDWRYSDCRNSSLREADVSDSVFSWAILNGVDFQKGTMLRSEFKYSKILGANFDSAKMKDTDFRGANIGHSSFRRTSLHQSRFEGAQIENADFSESFMTNSSLSGACLFGSVFDDTDLSNSKMLGMKFEKCSWEGAILKEVVIDRATFKHLPKKLKDEYAESMKFID